VSEWLSECGSALLEWCKYWVTYLPLSHSFVQATFGVSLLFVATLCCYWCTIFNLALDLVSLAQSVGLLYSMLVYFRRISCMQNLCFIMSSTENGFFYVYLGLCKFIWAQFAVNSELRRLQCRLFVECFQTIKTAIYISCKVSDLKSRKVEPNCIRTGCLEFFGGGAL